MENTVFQAEVLAIREGVKDYIKLNKRIIFFEDSQAALLALAKTSVTSKLVASTIDMLNILGKTVYTLKLCWIKAHTGHIGNERADEIVNKTKDQLRVLMGGGGGGGGGIGGGSGGPGVSRGMIGIAALVLWCFGERRAFTAFYRNSSLLSCSLANVMNPALGRMV